MAIEGKQFVMDYNNFSFKFHERALDAYLLEKHSDWTFLIEDALENEKKLFKCNKLMLSLASPIFKDLQSVSLSKYAKGPDDAIIIKGVSSQCFDIAMRFIYGKRVERLPTLDLATELAYFAYRWQINNLGDIAVAQFKLFEMGEGQYILLYMIYDRIKYQFNSYNHSLKTFYLRGGELMTTKKWFDEEKSILLLRVLSLNRQYYAVWNKEEHVFLGSIALGKRWAKLRGNGESIEAIRAELTDHLPLIMFRLISSAAFDRLCEMECCSILSDSEKVAISNCLKSGEASDMPPGFNTVDKRPPNPFII